MRLLYLVIPKQLLHRAPVPRVESVLESSKIMDENEEIEITALKKEMGEVGERNMNTQKKNRYIVLRQKQKSERRAQQEKIETEHKKSVSGKFGILFGLFPFIVIILIGWMVMNTNWKDYKSDCVIGRGSPDCLEGGGSDHPLWNN